MLIDSALAARRINPSDTDKFLATVLEVEEIFNSETGFIWSETTDKEFTYNNEFSRLSSFYCKLKNATLGSVVEAGYDASFSDSEEVFIFEDRLRRKSGYFKKYVKYVVSGGYVWAELPSDIKEAMLLQVEYALVRNSQEKIVQQYSSVGSGSGRYGNLYHPAFEKAIQRYKIIGIS